MDEAQSDTWPSCHAIQRTKKATGELRWLIEMGFTDALAENPFISFLDARSWSSRSGVSP